MMYSWTLLFLYQPIGLLRVVIWILLASLFPLSCILFGRRIHDIGFNVWAGFYGR